LSFNKTTLHLIVLRTPLNSYSKKCRTSLVLISGHKTAQTMAIATFEATEADASVVFTTHVSVKNNNFDQFNYGRPME